MQKGLCPGAVVIFDEGQNLAFHALNRGEIASFQDFANQDVKPNLDLVHPGSMLGGVVKNNA